MNKITIDETTRDDVTAMILRAKKRAGLGWAQMAEEIGMSPV